MVGTLPPNEGYLGIGISDGGLLSISVFGGNPGVVVYQPSGPSGVLVAFVLRVPTRGKKLLDSTERPGRGITRRERLSRCLVDDIRGVSAGPPRILRDTYDRLPFRVWV